MNTLNQLERPLDVKDILFNFQKAGVAVTPFNDGLLFLPSDGCSRNLDDELSAYRQYARLDIGLERVIAAFAACAVL